MSISMETGVFVTSLVWALRHGNECLCCLRYHLKRHRTKALNTCALRNIINVQEEVGTSALYSPGTDTAGSSLPTCPRCRRWAGRFDADTGCSVEGRTQGSRTGRRWDCRSRTPSCGTSLGRPAWGAQLSTEHRMTHGPKQLHAHTKASALMGSLNIHVDD